MLDETQKLKAEVISLTQQFSSLYDNLNGQGGVFSQLAAQKQMLGGLATVQSNTPASPVSNLLLNGEIGHSVNSWYDAAYNDTFTSKQTAWWWSHNAPATLQTFAAVTTANVIPLPGHNYTTGARVQFTNSGGALPTNLVAGTGYFAIWLSPDTISVSATLSGAFAGTVFAVPASGTGIQTIQEVLDELAQSPGSATDLSLKTYLPVGSGTANDYNPRYCRWDSVSGEAMMTGTMSLDQRLSTNFVNATTPLARVSLIAARRNSFIELPSNLLLACGIWDDTVGQNCFLSGSIGFTAEFIGTPTPGGLQRDFRALLTSDRGYQLLSPIVSVYNTPASLDAAHYVEMGWGQQSGQLQVEIYELVSGTYHLVAQISAATSFIYEGNYIQDVPGWPAPTGSTRDATFVTNVGDMTNLAVNAVSAAWDTINFPIEVPNNYNQANTTGHQWARLWMNVAPNLFVTGVGTDGTTTISLPPGAVDSTAFASGGYGSGSAAATCLYVGLVVQVYDRDDALLQVTSIATVNSDTSLVLNDAIADGDQRKIRIVGGGFHGLLVDKIHLGFQQNTSYAPNANDSRTLQPVAAPTSSDQGTVGGGGSGGGVLNCVAHDTPIKLASGRRLPVEECLLGIAWGSVGMIPNLFLDVRTASALVRGVRAANGVYVECTDSERFAADMQDLNGTPLTALRVGDCVMTEIDGRFEQSKIVEITPYLRRCLVYTPTLSGSRMFLAGRLILSRWQRLWNWVFRVKKAGAFVLHNRKSDPNDQSDPGVF